MKILEDESAQGSTEWILLIGGILAVVIVAIVWYTTYLHGLGNSITGGQEQQTLAQINSTLKPAFQPPH